ncbi:MAG: dihydrolipoamide acetyltransferase family protein [Pseudomonadota bacterium]
MSQTIAAVVMPKLGLSMTEGLVAAWHVEPGASVQPGDVIADIETSKITNELEAQAGGVFRRAVVEPGTEVPVGALIGVLADAGTPDAAIDEFVAGHTAADDGAAAVAADGPAAQAPVAAAAEPAEAGAAGTTGVPASLSGSYDPAAVFATHHAHKLARQRGIDLAQIAGSGRAGRISRADVTRAIEAAGGSLADDGGDAGAGRPKTTPVAARLAREHGIDLADIRATGSRGRITKGDVLRHIDRQAPTAASAESSNAVEELPLSPLRKRIAARLSASKSSAPHYRLSIELMMERMFALRAELGSESQPGPSVNDMLVRAVALALVEHPDVNIQFDGETVRRFRHADVAIAVALDSGLITPVLRNADRKDLATIARELADLSERARGGALSPDEVSGGTFTVSNLGMFGVTAFDAIINPPQAAILAVGTAERRLYVGDTDDPRVGRFATATLSCDHRVIDGAVGARFLQSVKTFAEAPGRLLMQAGPLPGAQ